MSTNSEEVSDEDHCRVVTEVALERAMEECGSEEAVRGQLRRLVGLEGDGLDPNCEQSLEAGLDEDELRSTRGTRQWVMCRAWELVKDGEQTLSTAVSQAWAEARAKGEELGVEV